ncbi:MAG: trypsin-like peptidase domain-containing protein [Fuerstiella sp.]
MMQQFSAGSEVGDSDSNSGAGPAMRPMPSPGRRRSLLSGRNTRPVFGVVLLWLAVCLVVWSGSGPATADLPESLVARQQQRIQTIERISPSVVCVMPPGGQGGGSGVLISADGYAISNYHVTSGSGDFMKCGLNDGKVYDAVIVGIDPTGDVALIRLLGRDDFPFCTPGNSDLVRTGDEVIALGNPFLLASDYTPTVTCGIVSGVHRYQYPAGTFLEYTDCIQIDASINPGNSGGPLFDIDGNWIGINGRASFEKRGRINTGAAYAISVRQVLLFIDHLKSGRIVDHGRVGFTVRTSPEGLVEVEQVSQLSEAWRRGLRQGDEIVSFAGRSLSSANDFKNILGIFPEGTRLPLAWRDSEGVRRVTVRLQPLHGFDEAPPLPQERQSEPEPRRPGDGDEQDPEDQSEKNPAEKDPVPDQYAHLFERRKGFANYYFNRQHQDRLLKPMAAQTSASAKDQRGRWLLQVKLETEAGPKTGELGIGSDAAWLQVDGLNSALQSRTDYDPQNEPVEFSGLLAGMMQWHRMSQNDQTLFSETVYHGSENLLPSGDHVDVLITQDGVITSRWYFQADVPWPVGVDIHLSAGEDEVRLRFRDWRIDGPLPCPGKIGVVDSDTEQIRWIGVESVRVSVGEEAGAAVSQSRSEVSS